MSVEGREPKLRFEFVGMLFAITISEIAIQFGDLVTKGPSLRVALPAYFHLLLCLMVVTTSWVGWSTSKSPGAKVDVAGVFSRTYLVLVMDVLLVVAYFILVKGVEVDKTSSGLISVVPSASPEAIWITVIFVGYLAWDILAKAVFQGEGAPPQFVARAFGPAFWERGWMSVLCLVLAFFAWSLVHPYPTAVRVIWMDVALISLVVLFRALKDRGPKSSWAIASSLLYLTGLIAAWN